MKELYKKYQLEVIRPDLSYIVEKYKTAYETYKTDYDKRLDESNNNDILITFKHAEYDSRK